ncbi:hypothetical protein ACPF04_02225 [Campylobacter sp. MOP51]|uniref:hypothetical protein n=1 Tax=Campylobacter canis TaxID=3378588 RepID=UPI003C4ABCB2
MSLFNFGKKDSTFADRVVKFWSEFCEIISDIKADLDAKEYEEARQKVEEKLKICLAEPYYMIGLKEGKPDLVLTPEGMKHRLLWLNFIKHQMPKELESKMICTLGKPPADMTGAAIQMYDIDVSAADTLVWTNIGENILDIEVYNENLAALAKDDENKAYTLLFILLDNTIGETAVINIVGEINILNEPKEGGMKLYELHKFVDENFGEKASNEPLKNFTVYEMTPNSGQIRDDIIVGNTCLTNLINEYISNKREIYNEAFELGIKFCFLAIDNGGDVQHGFDIRGEIEEQLQSFSEVFEIIGGATGTHYAYIDMICFDENRLKDIVKELSKKHDVKIQIYDFKK